MAQIQYLDLDGNIVSTEEPAKFTRTVRLPNSSSKRQRQANYVGNRVFVAGLTLRLITEVSTDGLAWKDEKGNEHPAADILG